MSDDYEELQKKQLFAQRVTAVSSVATAWAAHRAATSLEEMRQQASDAAEAAAQHQRKMQEGQQAQLAVIEEQAKAEAKEREYQRRVLFLKESDDATKLEAYLEMLKEKVSNFYRVPEVPRECQSDGEITRRIKTVADSIPMPEEVIRLKSEFKKLENEKEAVIAAQKGAAIGPLGIIGIVVGALFVLAGIVGLTDSKTFEPSAGGSQAEGIITGIFALLLSIGGGGWLLVAQVSKLIRSTKKPELEKQLGILNERLSSLETEMKPLQDEVFKTFNRTTEKYMNQWQSVVGRSMLQSFFDQGLWIEDSRFAEQIKVELTQIQKPFPTSCRTDVNNLRPEQIVAVYQTFTDTLAHLIAMCCAVGRDESDRVMRREKARPMILKILQSGPSSLDNECLVKGSVLDIDT